MKRIILILAVLLPLFFVSCASLPESPPVDPVKVQLPEPPPDYTEALQKIKTELGPAPQPVVITQGGITYFGFTKEQMVQFRLFNEAFAQLEEIIVSQHKQANIYFIETKTLKALAEAQNAQAQKYREMYEATRSSVKRAELEALGYKILTFGSIVAIIAIAF